ncbi:MAG: hypothetical protein CFE23_09045 [Flavobacterium sp. BFFFF1]|uniref:DUF1761 domain-containing protein n=1 Tax=Flavobacterium sp. BFFFF1 TaxID=2015557 RepID=UPI000BC40AFE|nr:DUF1761 domain-containing protein [Flavobacterium sp. BFFFF1]OYU80394.1 MAG: hypothetical protein CFE23_09045 [Flavobacterium sp. BFFFF1]
MEKFINFPVLFLAAAVSLLIGFIWYHPKVFGTVWMRETGMTMDDGKKPKMALIFSLVYIYSVFIAFIMCFITVHQMGALGMIGGPEFIDKAEPSYGQFISDYGTAFRTFKHGALHGFMTGLLFVLPMVAINSLFEKRSWKYILVTGFYWVIVCMLMGGIVCGWSPDGFHLT